MENVPLLSPLYLTNCYNLIKKYNSFKRFSTIGHKVQLYTTLTFWVLFSAEIPFFCVENGKFAVAKSVISHKPLQVTAIWLKIWQFKAIFNILIQSCRVLCNATIQFFPPHLLLFQAFSSVTNHPKDLFTYTRCSKLSL